MSMISALPEGISRGIRSYVLSNISGTWGESHAHRKSLGDSVTEFLIDKNLFQVIRTDKNHASRYKSTTPSESVFDCQYLVPVSPSSHVLIQINQVGHKFDDVLVY